eukprot:12741644-Heterocapsa_arctica.AAC.1
MDELNMKIILKYLAATRNYVMGLKVDRSADAGQLDVVVDASWANASDRRSTSGGIVKWCGFPVA